MTGCTETALITPPPTPPEAAETKIYFRIENSELPFDSNIERSDGKIVIVINKEYPKVLLHRIKVNSEKNCGINLSDVIVVEPPRVPSPNSLQCLGQSDRKRSLRKKSSNNETVKSTIIYKENDDDTTDENEEEKEIKNKKAKVTNNENKVKPLFRGRYKKNRKEKKTCSFCLMLFQDPYEFSMHEKECSRWNNKPETDIRNADTPTFLHTFGLMPTKSQPTKEEKTVASPMTVRRARTSKLSLTAFLKNNPVPISSNFGQKLVLESGIGKCKNPQEEVAKYEQFCSTSSKINKKIPKTGDWSVLHTRKGRIKPNQYSHKYTFGRRERIIRNSELVIGLSSKSWKAYNKCKNLSIGLPKLSPEQIATTMSKMYGTALFPANVPNSNQQAAKNKKSIPLPDRIVINGLKPEIKVTSGPETKFRGLQFFT